MLYIGNAGLHDQKIAQGEEKEGQADDLSLRTFLETIVMFVEIS
jgi:hypothetical protein